KLQRLREQEQQLLAAASAVPELQQQINELVNIIRQKDGAIAQLQAENDNIKNLMTQSEQHIRGLVEEAEVTGTRIQRASELIAEYMQRVQQAVDLLNNFHAVIPDDIYNLNIQGFSFAPPQNTLEIVGPVREICSRIFNTCLRYTMLLA